jgi:hypothetical protein
VHPFIFLHPLSIVKVYQTVSSGSTEPKCGPTPLEPRKASHIHNTLQDLATLTPKVSSSILFVHCFSASSATAGNTNLKLQAACPSMMLSGGAALSFPELFLA